MSNFDALDFAFTQFIAISMSAMFSFLALFLRSINYDYAEPSGLSPVLCAFIAMLSSYVCLIVLMNQAQKSRRPEMTEARA